MSVGQEFWIVAGGRSREQQGQNCEDGYMTDLKSCAALSAGGGPWNFSVSDGGQSLLFGSFDNLIRLTDELQKCDASVDSIVHRLERQFLELDPKAEFKVKSQRQEKALLDYLKVWQWDEAKYPKTRSISDNLTLLMSVVNKLDEETRLKTAAYNDYKTQKGNLAKKEGTGLPSRDLVDVLTPDVVNVTGSPDDDFITTEYMATVPVILPRGTEQDFLKTYETMVEGVVPMSARKFAKLDDKEGNSIWRVVMFKSAVEGFKKHCREKRLIMRDFEYDPEAYKKLKNQRESLDDMIKRHYELVKGLYSAAWSDAMCAWMHIKAMRVFVESVLRFGMPPSFASFIVSPKPSSGNAARKNLTDILGKQGPSGPYGKDKLAEAAEDDAEEYYPYVSFSFTPFTVARESKL